MTVARQAPTRPNVIWIFGDQHRAQAMSCMGDPNLSTPNLDRLAGGPGTTAVSGCPLCSPFRGSMLTSLYPHHCVTAHDWPMPDGLPTIATVFRESGYRTAYFGKWHVDGENNRPDGVRPALQRVAPSRRGGFELWLGYENNNRQYDSWVHGHDAAGNEVEHYRLPGYETDTLTDLLLEYLADRSREKEEGNARPFFASLSVQPPHGPYVAPEEWTRRHDSGKIELRPNVPPIPRVRDAARTSLANYYAMIENLDWNVGRIVDALKSGGLARNTLIVFFSDHGDMHGSQGRILKCVPWEESIRIPFIVAMAEEPDPGNPMNQRWNPKLVNHVDIAPTTLGLCGIDPPGWMTGVDYSGHYLPDRPLPSAPPDSAYLQLCDPGWTCGYAIDRERPWRGIVTDDGWKYAVLEGQPWLLYNLNEDPFEQVNLALDGRFWAERRRLQERLRAWIEETGDTFKLPDIDVVKQSGKGWA